MSDKNDGEILHIKIADLRATAPHFHMHSTDLGKALTKLQMALFAAGAPWGDDEQGTAFRKAYAPHVKRIEQSADILAQGLASIHEAMVDMADGHIDNEDLVRSMFSKITVKGQGGDAGK
ncbi:WXG100 family type VII secretion target [Streptomyces sp. NPDC058297]|uniref:WXG100 family type VII secretion target n=1 Tax=Streptomyces sp. NPDC058297 TaxID=3346433 RepID=UPI0036E42460